MQALTPDKKRITSVDLLRGAVMIIMALDHTREFFHSAALTSNPLDLSTTTPLLFFTRWITHFCAPVFVFFIGHLCFPSICTQIKKGTEHFFDYKRTVAHFGRNHYCQSYIFV